MYSCGLSTCWKSFWEGQGKPTRGNEWWRWMTIFPKPNVISGAKPPLGWTFSHGHLAIYPRAQSPFCDMPVNYEIRDVERIGLAAFNSTPDPTPHPPPPPFLHSQITSWCTQILLMFFSVELVTIWIIIELVTIWVINRLSIWTKDFALYCVSIASLLRNYSFQIVDEMRRHGAHYGINVAQYGGHSVEFRSD